MTRFASTIGFFACAAALLAVSTISSVSAHGYMSSPTPRGIAKVSYLVDDVKNPNTKGICRGEPAGKVTDVGHSVTLGLTITAPHIGMCEVYILDENLSNARKIASKDGCAAPGKVGPWSVEIPSDITGRKVLRWVWNAAHLVTTIEHYEQCADINISGGGGKPSAGKKTGDTYEDAPAKDTPAKDTPAEDDKSNNGDKPVYNDASKSPKRARRAARRATRRKIRKAARKVARKVARRTMALTVQLKMKRNLLILVLQNTRNNLVLNAAAMVASSTVNIN
ncbi:hypothetical protein BDF19DRAFT_498967 [Syncephalis fuscata]|nr:hypothetical protein BDF19DRAFT_498967 [Syncephalis fuscata]